MQKQTFKLPFRGPENMGVVPKMKGFKVAKKLCIILSVNVSVQNGL